MDFETLKKKKVVNGDMDLLSNFLKIDFDKVIIEEWILVDDYSEMLLDLISFVKYGTSDYVDILIKFNRISNPFEIVEGDIIAVPNLDSLRDNSKYIDLVGKQIKTQKAKGTTSVKLSNNAPRKMTPSSNYTRRGGNIII